MSESLRHQIITLSVFFTCVVIDNVSATPDVGVLKTFYESFECVFTCIVFHNASATPDEPPPKSFNEFIQGVSDMYCLLQCVSEAR